MFQSAIVLGEDEFEGRGDLRVEEFEEFLGAAFEEVLGAYGVDEAIVHLNGEWVSVADGRGFVAVVKKVYEDMNGLLGRVEGKESIGIGETVQCYGCSKGK